MSILRLFFLGSPRIECNGEPIKIDTHKAIALLAYLAVTGERGRRDFLVNLLWPNYDQTRARTVLRRNLYALNKALSGDWLDSDRETIGLNSNSDLWLDVDQFHSCLSECRGHAHLLEDVCPDCVKPLTEAVELYRDDFLAGFSLKDSVVFDDWQFSQTQSLRSEMISVLKRLVHLHNGQEEFEAAIGYARRWLEMDRTIEEAHRQLMELYARTGGRAAALRQYEECVRLLKEELNESPQETTVQLYGAIKGNTFPQKKKVQSAEVPSFKSPDTPRDNLPRQLTSFIGRESEIAEVKRLLATTYLLTLTGAGGCGKTRLALEVAADLIKDYEDGVWVVELAPLSNPDLVPQEVASVFDVSEQPGRPLSDTLSDYFKSRQILLVLDNCEHLIESCAALAETLLRACPNLKILATSREGLDINGELIYRVPSLSLPDLQKIPSPEEVKSYEAIRLFMERTTFSQPNFEITDRNIPSVTKICHRLDGIPLAIELAAARVKALSVEEITDRLDDRFGLLMGGSRTALPRHQTLKATIDWSYDLLPKIEQGLLNRLTVFMGGWTLAAAEAVCGDFVPPHEVLNLLTNLVDKSLVVAQEDDGKTRYNFLETVRQYGKDKLIESGEEKRVRDLHLDFFVEFAIEAEPEIDGGRDGDVWLRLMVEYDNVRTALEWSRESGKVEEGLRVSGAISWSWFVQGYYSEGRQWLEEFLRTSSVNEKSDTSAFVRAKALRGAGFIAIGQGDIDRAIELGEQSLALCQKIGDKPGLAESFRVIGVAEQDPKQKAQFYEKSLKVSQEAGDKRGIAWSLWLLANVAINEEDYEHAVTLFQESLPLFREVGDRPGVAWSITWLGNAMVYQGEHENAQVLLEEGLALSRKIGDKWGAILSLRSLGNMEHGKGDIRRARTLYQESLSLMWEIGINKGSIPWYLEALAMVAVAQDQLERGARLFGAAEGLRDVLNFSMEQNRRDDYDRSITTLRDVLDEETLTAAWAEGRAMTLEEAIELALLVDNVH